MADTTYRAKTNEDFLSHCGRRSQIHRHKPTGKLLPKPTAKANARECALWAMVEHAFAQLKARMKLAIRSIGRKRAEATVIMANIAESLGR